MKTIKYLAGILLLSLLQSSCGREFLDEKRDKKQVTPSTISDFQAMMDYLSIMNVNSCHELGVIGADEYSVSDDRWSLLRDPYQKNAYIWADEVYEDRDLGDWNEAYFRILYANMALEGLRKISPLASEMNVRNNVMGQALFFRAINFYQVAQQFCKPFDQATAANDPGIPLRLEQDITLRSTRASVLHTYQRVIEDALEAVAILPERPLVKYRPSKPAAFALLAKTYLLMGDYANAKSYADACLAYRSELTDFNDVDASQAYSFSGEFELNPELIFICSMQNIVVTATSRINIADDLLALYDENDLRRNVYFGLSSDRTIFKGSYMGNALFFTGLALDEVYLIRAEANARMGDEENAIADLNFLLRHRMRREGYQPLVVTEIDDVLALVIEERRKELVLRGVRWEDLRRLNKEPQFAKTLTREVEASQYSLAPNSPKYTWPIPDSEVDLSKIEQNPRE